MNYMWLSFRNEGRNRNLGVCIIEDADNVKIASQKAWDLGINPGGEILGYLLSEEEFKQESLEPGKLYTREEMVELGYHVGI